VKIGLKPLLILSIGINVYFIVGDVQTRLAPDSAVGQVTRHAKVDMKNNHARSSESHPVDSRPVSLAERAEVPPVEMVDCAIHETSADREMPQEAQSVESSAEQQFRQDYLMEYEQQTEYAYTQIQSILHNAEIKGTWDQSDQSELQRYTAYITPKTIEDLIMPFLNNSLNMDMQVPLDFNVFNNGS
jgi:hypothetical protein